MYVVIMAGGGGTRLRPVSTAERPKPFLPLLPTGETLLQRTVRRLEGPELGPVDVYVVASAAYEGLVAAQVAGATLVVEPEGRNTAAAIALAALAVDRPDDEVMVVLPADHRIDPAREGVFRAVLRDAADGLATGAFGVEAPLVTLGVQPTFPATQYGYLVPRHEAGERRLGLDAYPLAQFREKPDAEAAAALLASPGTAWNAGMFLWRRGSIRAALEAHAPDVVAAVGAGLASGDLAGAYGGIAPRSIDYAVMEPAATAGSVLMAAMDVGWTDVGTWAVLLEVLGAGALDGTVVEAGTAATTREGDLVVDRDHDGLVVRPARDATMVAERPVALLRGAAAALPIVQALLDRCAAAEARA
ncbi:MAG TPA: sugar phosphate nucleotidyltransferase [Candidatus Limnocylindrales bacterium]|nr:sugar phosphate nucleotidyltransferase [Candidatus Limnocylindrales bacterium]